MPWFQPNPAGFVIFLIGLLVWVLANRIAWLYFYGHGPRVEHIAAVANRVMGAALMLVGTVSAVGWMVRRFM